ncbi:carbohydrate ABC transporter permease [Lacipirellula limnantheis]|uniref:Lactose transport system permease protein LacF n=1 Tax=Lacipirellula limnantheis TaxID=2528024 RepID=A0A517U0M4_9BACT|nr:sugar ABC transporter permease [Lacipirellula limnantheis]QDT74174.1 Lactose transport system permease protein LacF [Lacipirellula limnantheis]
MPQKTATVGARSYDGPSSGWWFAGPAVAIIAVFFLAPIAASILLSLTDFDIYALADWQNLRFVGLQNYIQLFHTYRFWVALHNTLYFVAIGGPLSVAASLGAALLLESKLTRLKVVWRTVFFAPVVTTLVAVAIVWRYLYHTKYGLFNLALTKLGFEPIDWLGDPHWAMPAVIFLAVWKNFGYNMIIFMAGLQSIPSELYEAAEVDGAGPARRFWHVTLPMLAPTFLFVGVTTIIGFFQLFAEPYVMTQGGPEESTYSLVMLMYEQGFRWWRLGFASAAAMTIFGITLAATLAQIWLQRKSGV